MILRKLSFRKWSFLLLLAPSLALAQPYRWTDEKGRVYFSDNPPASSKGVPVVPPKPAIAPPAPAGVGQLPYELQHVQKDFPVTLFSAPSCKKACDMARDALNERGVPFTEILVWSPETQEQLKARAGGSDQVPALIVGRSSLIGFDSVNYDSLLDSAGYPRRGVLPARAQKAPAPPEGYQPPPVAEPIKDASSKPKPGPYDTSGLPSNRSDKPGPYDASGLKATTPERTGPYLKPEAAKQ